MMTDSIPQANSNVPDDLLVLPVISREPRLRCFDDRISRVPLLSPIEAQCWTPTMTTGVPIPDPGTAAPYQT